MSLDVHLISDKPVKRRGTSVFVRDKGKTIELTPDQVLDRWPGTKVEYSERETNEVFTANITHNLNKMAQAADIYTALWRSDEHGWDHAKNIIGMLERGLKRLKKDPEKFKKFNPENGWGSYEQLVNFVESYLVACKQYPDAKVEISR